MLVLSGWLSRYTGVPSYIHILALICSDNAGNEEKSIFSSTLKRLELLMLPGNRYSEGDVSTVSTYVSSVYVYCIYCICLLYPLYISTVSTVYIYLSTVYIYRIYLYVYCVYSIYILYLLYTSTVSTVSTVYIRSTVYIYFI